MKLYEIRVLDGGRVIIDLEKICVILLPSQFAPKQQVAQVTFVGNVNIQMSIADAQDLVEVMKNFYDIQTYAQGPDTRNNKGN